jgi:hypothetical protein
VAVLATAGGAAALVGVLAADGAAPSNDDFVAAVPVADSTFAGSTAGATVSAEEAAADAGTVGERAVWFSWEAPHGGWAYFTPTLADGAFPEVRVFEGDELTELDRVDVPAEAGEGTEGSSVPAEQGKTYAIAVLSADEVDFDLTIFQPDFGVAPNDEPETALDAGAAVLASVGGGEQEVAVDTLAGATAASGEASPVGGTPERSVWFSWSAEGAGQATFAAAGEFGDAGPFALGAWTGTGTADLVLVGGGTGSVTFTAAPGEHYFISVDGPAEWYRLTVATSGVPGEDIEPPAVTCDPAPDGWTIELTLTVHCSASDAGSGLADAADVAFDLIAEIPEGAETDEASTDSRTICDLVGNCTDAGPLTGLRFDHRAPALTCDPVPEDWSATDPQITCSAVDEGSGLADDGDAERVLASGVVDGQEAQVTLGPLTVCDVAGNCTTAPAFAPLSVDRKAPSVTCGSAPAGIQTDDIVIDCTATDGGSGLTDPEGGSFSLVTEVGEGNADLDASTTSHEVCDAVGNCATAGPVDGLQVDRAAPGVRCVPPEGWQRGLVQVDCEVTDIGTGLAAGVVSPVTLIATLPDGEASDRVETTSQGGLCDAAGNCTTAGPLTLQIDNQEPVVECPTPSETWSDAAEVAVDCSADDGDGSGLADADQAVVRLEATMGADQEGTVGTGSEQVCDAAGNCTTAGPVGGVRIDRRAPDIVCDPPPTGTVRTEVTIACTVADGGSGIVGDTEFGLSTAVGTGNADPAAETSSREVCDLAGNCSEAGPFTVSVDLTAPAAGDGPEADAPGRITVLAAVAPPEPVPVPYELPDAGDAEVTCAPSPGTVLGEGWTIIACEAVDSEGRATPFGFPLVVKPLPQLAPTGSAIRGGAWRTIGVGFAPGSAVVLEIDGQQDGGGLAGADGRISIEHTLPNDLSPGEHQFVLRGQGGNGDPLLVVSLVAVQPPAAGEQPPASPPPAAPSLPDSGPEVPDDPGPPPALPDVALGEVPPTTTPPPTTPPSTGNPRPGDPPDDPTATTAPSASPGADDAFGSGAGRAGEGGGLLDSIGRPLGPATLPVTGLAVSALMLLALLLIAGGGSLRAGADRLRGRSPR